MRSSYIGDGGKPSAKVLRSAHRHITNQEKRNRLCALSRKKCRKSVYLVRLYIGGRDQLHRMSDDEVCKFETDLIDHVFAKIERPLLYKPYPARRYPIPIPLSRAKSVDTIDVVENGPEAFGASQPRSDYIKKRFDCGILPVSIDPVVCLLPSGKFATGSWCRAAEIGFFLRRKRKFEPGDISETPNREIESLWRDLAPEREEFMKQFIAVNLGGAGAKIASELAQLMKDSNSRDKDVVWSTRLSVPKNSKIMGFTLGRLWYLSRSLRGLSRICRPCRNYW